MKSQNAQNVCYHLIIILFPVEIYNFDDTEYWHVKASRSQQNSAPFQILIGIKA
jgi:hypothetical protein